MNKKQLIVFSITSLLLLTSCRISKRQQTESQGDSTDFHSDVIPTTFDPEKVAENIQNMKSFKLTFEGDFDYSAELPFLSVSNIVSQRVERKEKASLVKNGEELNLRSEETKTKTLSLTDLATLAGTTVEELPSQLESLEDYIEGYTEQDIELDQTNGVAICSKPTSITEINNLYDKEAKQYYYVYKIGDGKLTSKYQLDSSGSMDVTDGMFGDIGTLFNNIKDGNYNKKTGVLSKTFETSYRLGSENYLKSIEVTIRDNYVTDMKCGIDVEASFNITSAEVKKAVVDYKFENINSASITYPDTKPVCKSSHKEFSYDHQENGHRKYCKECYKYLGELEEHHHNDHNYCEVCEGLYDVEDYIPEEFEEHAFVKIKKAKNGTELFAKGVDYSYPGMKIKYQDSTSWYVYPEEGMVLKYSNDYGDYFIENNCSKIVSYTYNLYKGLTIVLNESNEYTFNGETSIKTAVAELTPVVISALGFTVSHYSTTKTEEVIDTCHTHVYYTCGRCGEITSDDIVTNHVSETFEVVKKSDLPFTPSVEREVYIKGSCEECDEVSYYGVDKSSTYDHDHYSMYVMQYDPEDGDYIHYSTPINIPHIFDDDGVCEICGAEQHEVGPLVFLIEFNYSGYKVINEPTLKATGEKVPSGNTTSTGGVVEEHYVKTYFYYDRNTEETDKVELGRMVVHFDDEYGFGNVSYVELISGTETVKITGDIYHNFY